MADLIADALARAVASLTYDEIETVDLAGAVIATGESLPLLRRSIGRDLEHIEKSLGLAAIGSTILSKIALSIDEALLGITEAQAAHELL